MKRITLIIYVLLSANVFARPQPDMAAISISDAGETGLLLNSGWKFHAGDDPAFARVDYNDQNWHRINPAAKIPQLSVPVGRNMGWLRIKFSVAPALRRTAALLIQQSLAVDIYLNGKLIGRHGVIDSRLKTGRGYFDMTAPIELPVSGAPVQVLAVRFAPEEGLAKLDQYLLPYLFRARFVTIKQPVTFINQVMLMESPLLIGASILVLLAVLHLIILRYNTTKRANLYFACYTLCFAVFVAILSSKYFPQPVLVLVILDIVGSIFYAIATFFCIQALYVLFGFKSGILFKLLIALSVVCLVGYVFSTRLYFYSYFGLGMVLSIFQISLAIKAIRHKKRGAWFVGAGFLLSLLGIAEYAGLVIFFQAVLIIPFVLSYFMIVLGPAMGISLFLGREFALDARLLQIKLGQVEELSATNIAYEQEKQQILASQNQVLEHQVAERTLELNKSLNNLKAAQAQLIQQEKLASLGELTAGIAHEIQNPLNFVNNFSEVNQEIIEELEDALKSGDIGEALSMAGEIKENETKINHHGKRADFIVKGMLQHSRAATGQKEPTDLNKLADEYLRLAYHGMRAKDKGFNTELVTHFDERLPVVNIVQQDIGRVLLNLFNNAFYAVQQKEKAAGTKPIVEVSTTITEDFIEITVKDNGTGIPDAIKHKIMQPFFTTKPTGEGTGLGLSLSYDIVVKGHGGRLQVDTPEIGGAVFTVTLPINPAP